MSRILHLNVNLGGPRRHLLPMAFVTLASLAFSGSARATDNDSDGSDTTDTPPDCDDGDDKTSPREPEDGRDDVDNDCDGSVLVHRTYTNAFTIGALADLVVGADVDWVDDSDGLLHFDAGANAIIELDGDLAFKYGLFMVVVKVSGSNGTPGCGVHVVSTSMGSTWRYFSGVGVHAMDFANVMPEDDITTLEIACPGTGWANLDWMTVQNSPYGFSPMNDVGLKATTTGLPGIGRQSVVRASSSGSTVPGNLMFVGSDVGGFGWSEGGDVWYTANGRSGEWESGGSLGVWEAWALDEHNVDEQNVIVLTGHKDSADGGGLWRTDNLAKENQHWEKIESVDGDLGASKHIDACVAENDKPIGSGRLIVNHPDDVYGQRFLVASGDPDTTGLYVWVDDPFSAWFVPDQPAFAPSLPADALPAALAIDSSGEYLLVGYRPISGDSVEHGALYVCPADFDDLGADDCALVASDAGDEDPEDRWNWAGDIRDIEADPNVAGRFYVADGGRRWDEGADDCDLGESTVFVVNVSGSLPTPTVNLYDTDSKAGATDTNWTDAADYYGTLGKGCADNNTADATVYGDLVPPLRGSGAQGYALSSIATDPDGTFLFAFYPYPDDHRNYGCVRTFRVATEAIEADATPWRPFQGWEEGKVDFHDHGGGEDAHSASRRASVGVEGAYAEYDAFQVAEPLLEDWGATNAHDAVFVQGREEYQLLVGGSFLWLIQGNGGFGAGWDYPDPWDGTSFTLDQTEIDLAWNGEGPVFQDATAKKTAVAQGVIQFAGSVIDLALVAGIGDYKMARIYGEPPYDPRPAADRSSETHMLASTGYDVAIWQDNESEEYPQAWMSLVPQAGTTDVDRFRGLLYLDDVTTDKWCWDAVELPNDYSGKGSIAVANYVQDEWTPPTTHTPDGTYELHAQDSSLSDPRWWDACDEGSSPANLGGAGVGIVHALAAVGSRLAILSAEPAEQAGAIGDPSGEGLWIAEYTPSTGIAYTQVAFDEDALGAGSGACTQAEFFAATTQVSLTLDPASDPIGIIRGWVTSREADCDGVAEFNFDIADPATVTWSNIDISACDLVAGTIRASAVSRDGRWLMVVGGPGSAGGGACAIDFVESTVEVPATGADIDIEFKAVMAHPHIDDAFYVGGIADTDTGTHEVLSTDDAGVYGLERRYSIDDSGWEWHATRLSGDDLEHRTVVDVDWGYGFAGMPFTMSHLYITTAGGGVWDASVDAN